MKDAIKTIEEIQINNSSKQIKNCQNSDSKISAPVRKQNNDALFEDIGNMQPDQMQSSQMQSGQMQSGQMQSGQMQPGQMQSGQTKSGQMQSGLRQPDQMQSGQMEYVYKLSRMNASSIKASPYDDPARLDQIIQIIKNQIDKLDPLTPMKVKLIQSGGTFLAKSSLVDKLSDTSSFGQYMPLSQDSNSSFLPIFSVHFPENPSFLNALCDGKDLNLGSFDELGFLRWLNVQNPHGVGPEAKSFLYLGPSV